MTEPPRWKKMADSFRYQAQRAEEDLRCRETIRTTVCYGEFVELPSWERCTLDVDHEGECTLKREWERRNPDPKTEREHPLS